MQRQGRFRIKKMHSQFKDKNEKTEKTELFNDHNQEWSLTPTSDEIYS